MRFLKCLFNNMRIVKSLSFAMFATLLLSTNAFAAWTVEATIYSPAFSDLVYVATDGTQKKVFLNGDETKEMTTTANPVTISGSCATGLEIDGFYASQTPTIGTDRLIDANGYITVTGLALAQTYTGGDFVALYGACKKTCAVGTYFRTSDKTCATCPDGNVCKGVTVTSNTTDQGKTAAYTITLNNNGGTGGTTKIYALSDGAYLTNSTLMSTSGTATRITKPTKSGWTFMGYYRSTSDTGNSYRYINNNGNITSYGNNAAKALTANATWYARWSLTCAAGTYWNGSACVACESGSYCAGATVYDYNSSTTIGKSSCPSGYAYSAPKATANTACYSIGTTSCDTYFTAGHNNTTSNYTLPANATGVVYGNADNPSSVSCKRYYNTQTCIPDADVCEVTGLTCNQGFSSSTINSSALSEYASNTSGGSYNYVNLDGTYGPGTTSSEPYHAPGMFDVTIDGNLIHGRVMCSNTAGTTTAAIGNPSSSSGAYCWAKTALRGSMSGQSYFTIAQSDWVYISSYTSYDQCAQECASTASQYLANPSNASTYRASFFNNQHSFTCVPSVEFNLNGAIFANNAQSEPVQVTYGEPMPAISKSVPIRTGYNFAGWYDNPDYKSGTQYYTAGGVSARNWDKRAADGSTIGGVLYAGWAPRTTDVSFNANGGTGGQSKNVTATYGEEMPDIDPTPPTRSGYLFAGWYDTIDTGGTQYYTANGEPANTWWYGNAKKTLFARWEQPVSGAITLNKNGGDTVSPSTVYTKYGTGVYTTQADANAGTNAISALTTVPKKANYRFKGFYTAASGGLPIAAYNGAFFGTASTAVTTAGGTTTWYAQYSPLYTVTLNKQEGTGGTNSFYLATDKYISSDNYGLTELSTVSVPTRTGYKFNGYYSAASDGTQYIDANGNILQALRNAASSATAGFEIYAQWTPNTITIVWDNVASGAKFGSVTAVVDANNRAESTVSYGGSITTPSKAVERTGARFKGWRFSRTPND